MTSAGRRRKARKGRSPAIGSRGHGRDMRQVGGLLGKVPALCRFGLALIWPNSYISAKLTSQPALAECRRNRGHAQS